MTATEYKESGSNKKIEDTRTIKDKKVKWCLLAGNSEVPLEEKEWPSKYLPIVPFYGDVTVIDGKLVLQELLYHAKDSLRMLSYFRSTEIELLALTPKAPYVGTQAQFENHPEWDDANTVAYSKLTYTPDPQAAGAPQRQGFASPPTGVLQGAVNSQNDMNDILNIHEASLGQQGNETSGKAINARQRQGDTSTYNFPNNWAKSVSQITKILVDLIPKIYDTPRVVRILGEDGSEKMTPVNKKFIETKNGEKVQSIYNLGVGTYDVVSSVGPSYQTRRQEEAEVLQAMLQGNPALMQTHGDIIAETLDFPGSEKFAARTRKMIPKELLDQEGDEPQLPPEVMQEMEGMKAQIDQMNQAGQALHQELLAAQDKLQLEQMKIQVDQFNAETARMKAEGELALKAQSQRPNADSLTDTLTEAEKIQHDTELQIRMQEMKEDHEKEMAVLNARLDRLKSSASIMVDIDDDGNEVDSAYVVAINELQGQLEQQSAAFSDVINRMTQPEEIVRDDEGNIIGAKTGIGFKKIVRDEKGNPIGVEIV